MHPADEDIGPGTGGSTSRSATARPRTTLIVIVTKIDKVAKDRVAAQLLAVDELAGEHAAAIVPVSATKGDQVDVLIDVIVEHLAPGPAFIPTGSSPTSPKRC